MNIKTRYNYAANKNSYTAIGSKVINKTTTIPNGNIKLFMLPGVNILSNKFYVFLA